MELLGAHLTSLDVAVMSVGVLCALATPVLVGLMIWVGVEDAKTARKGRK